MQIITDKNILYLTYKLRIFDTMNLFIDNYNDWINLAKSFVGDKYAQDIVQEAYIKIHNKQEVNRSYIYLTIKHLSLDLLKSNQKVIKVDVYDFEEEVSDLESKEYFEKIISKIEKELNSWTGVSKSGWYNSTIFSLYKDTPLSLRQLAAETDISVVSIFHTVKDCKQIIRTKFAEDYEDYKNGDYELI